jgi:hypothetical protein
MVSVAAAASTAKKTTPSITPIEPNKLDAKRHCNGIPYMKIDTGNFEGRERSQFVCQVGGKKGLMYPVAVPNLTEQIVYIDLPCAKNKPIEIMRMHVAENAFVR